MVTLPEAIVVARWLAQPERKEILDGFRARYGAWHARAADKLEELSVATSREDAERALALHVENRALCPFNQRGDCTVYPARPILCREAHALYTAANCGPEAAQPARTIPFPQLDEFVVKCKTALWALHHALPGTGHLRLFPLPLAVARLLDEMGV